MPGSVAYTVVAWYGDVNVSQWRAGVTEGYHWDVDIGGLCDGLQREQWKNRKHLQYMYNVSTCGFIICQISDPTNLVLQKY